VGGGRGVGGEEEKKREKGQRVGCRMQIHAVLFNLHVIRRASNAFLPRLYKLFVQEGDSYV